MRLKWVLQMCIFVLKNSIKGYLSHFKSDKKIYVHTSPPRWYWVSPSRAFSRGCGRFGDCVWQTDSGLSEGWTSAQLESVWIAGTCCRVLTIPRALWWKKSLLLLLATFKKLDVSFEQSTLRKKQMLTCESILIRRTWDLILRAGQTLQIINRKWGILWSSPS